MIRAKKSLIAKRSLGQNFLQDEKILKKIADFARIEKKDTVVEVGPGEGSLTEFLLEKAKKVVAIEKDERLAELLREKFRKHILDNRLEIVVGDILNYELRIKNYALVGNIPYYITGALFKKFLESKNQPESITFVVQKEVAERIMAHDKKARPSHKATAGKESILSISVKAYGKPEYGGTIKAGSFIPAPKVDSAIIAVRNISKERFAPMLTVGVPAVNKISQLEKRFFEILKKGFAHKRKLLMRNLETEDIEKLKKIFEKCNIEKKARAEDLSVDDWFCLVRELI